MRNDLLESTTTPTRHARINGVQPPSGPGSSSGGPLSLSPSKKCRAPLCSSPSPGSSSLLSIEKKGLFFSAEQASKIAMINNMAKLWGLPPYVTPEGTLPNLEDAQVRFVEVPPFHPTAPLSYLELGLYIYMIRNFLGYRVRLCARFPHSMCPR